jgi:hypothetical protein
MGADLIASWIWTTQPQKIDFEKARALIREEFDALDKADDVFPQGFLERWDPNEDVVWDGSDTTAEEFRNALLSDTNHLEQLWTEAETPRDAFVADIGPVRVLLSGGMSWGDSPTEEFDVLNRWGNTPAAKAAGFFDWEATPTDG